jgi:hypothetical protein
MATVTADAAQSYARVPGHGMGGNLKVATGTYEIASALSQNDIIQFCKVPAGAVVVGGWLMGDDLDTGTEALEIDIGWTDDTDGFLNSGVITGDATTDVKPVAGILYQLQGVLLTAGPKLFSSETTLIGTVVAAANAGGTGTITLTVLYFIDPEFEV